MNITRREALLIGAGGAVMLALPSIAQAKGLTEEAIASFTGGAPIAEGGVDLNTPEIAENGNTVPVEVSAEGATAILLLADGNPTPGVATFHFGPLAGSSSASTRIRLSKTQNVVAIAKMADGSFAKATREVKVTIGGCGG
ncbi:MAG: thiosulfate oxidation carrier protein SoxY [Neomegalonema sp.]|nr:thiosulfate oxidation carrier protein SoxY [Neomegalonema sp.]